MASIHLIRFEDRETRIRAIGAFRNVSVAYVRFPGDVFGVGNEHVRALKKGKIPFIYVSKEPTPKGKHAPTIQS
jgi:hypothetical protein